MSNKVLKCTLAVLSLGILLLAAAYFYKHRSRVDEFGRAISIHPGNAKVSPGAGATLEDPAIRQRLPEYQEVPAAPASELTPALSEAALTAASLPASPGDLLHFFERKGW